MWSTKIFLAMIFNEIKCRVSTSLGLVGAASPVSAPALFATSNLSLRSLLFSWTAASILPFPCYSSVEFMDVGRGGARTPGF